MKFPELTSFCSYDDYVEAWREYEDESNKQHVEQCLREIDALLKGEG